jgi:hypothetical protein
MDLAFARRLYRAAHTTLKAVTSLPRLMVVLVELRDAVKQIERLATFAAQELPEMIYQLEGVRAQLTAIEQRLGAGTGLNGREPSRDEPRTGSPRPS